MQARIAFRWISGKRHFHLSHDFVLAFLNVLSISPHNGFQELEVLNVFSMRFNAVDEVMDHTVADLVAKLVVVHENVAHRLCFQQLWSPRMREMEILKKEKTDFMVCITKNG